MYPVSHLQDGIGQVLQPLLRPRQQWQHPLALVLQMSIAIAQDPMCIATAHGPISIAGNMAIAVSMTVATGVPIAVGSLLLVI